VLLRDEEKKIIDEAKVDPAKFDLIYHGYSQEIFNFVRMRVRDVNTAEDITAEVFFKAFKHLKNFRFEASFLTYLLRIALNETSNLYRRNHSYHTTEVSSEELEQKELNSEELDPDDLNKLRIEISKLPHKEREIIIMHFIENRNMDEVRFILNISKTSSYRLLRKALDMLKREIEKNGR